MNRQEIDAFVAAAIECSVYVAPLEPGLSHSELIEVCKRVNLQAGEVGDALSRASFEYFEGTQRLRPDQRVTVVAWEHSLHAEEPEYRNFEALDFIVVQFNAVIRSEGRHGARLERNVIVERAIKSGIDRKAVDVELTIMVLSGRLIEKNGVLTSRYGVVQDELPSAMRRKSSMRQVIRRPMRARAYPLVKDVIERRTDGRPKQAEPLDAFTERLTTLGYGMFRLWWTQTVRELLRSDFNTSPTATCVLSGALVEAALTFVVRHARALGLDTLKSTDFVRDPRTWKIDDLVNSAGRGGESAILKQGLLERARNLVHTRQRVHAGRMLSEYPAGPPDLRPEEAREAKETTEGVVRAILDWLDKYPVRSDGERTSQSAARPG
jgi:hypothetical protein